MLKRRYHNTRIIIQKRVRAIFELPQYVKDLEAFLRDTYDKVNKHIRPLSSLEQPVDKWDSVLIYLISSKLDNNIAREWELTLATKYVPTTKDLLSIIDRKAVSLQMVNKTTTRPLNFIKERKIIHAAITNTNKWILCSEDPSIFYCKNFMKSSIEKRRDRVKQHNLCFNCLKRGHKASDCNASKYKKKCLHSLPLKEKSN